MILDVTYAEMSFVRELVHKYQYERWVQEIKRIGKKELEKLDHDDIEELRQHFWRNHDHNPPLVNEDCAVLLTKKCNKIE